MTAGETAIFYTRKAKMFENMMRTPKSFEDALVRMAEDEAKQQKFPIVIPVGHRKLEITEEDVRKVQRDLLDGKIEPKSQEGVVGSREIIDAILSWFCVGR